VEAGLPHVGWNTIMIYNEGGKDIWWNISRKCIKV